MAKSTENIMLQRIGEIVVLLLEGSSRDVIVQYATEKWKIGIRQTDTYISKARESIKVSVKKDIQYDYSKAIRRYEDLYKKTIEKKDYKTAVAINKELANLQGLFVQQVEHSGEITFICSVPD